jgi:hypothetical protein
MQQHWLSRNASLNQPNRPDCGGTRLSGQIKPLSTNDIINPTIVFSSFLTDANIDASCNRTHDGSNRVVCVDKIHLNTFN